MKSSFPENICPGRSVVLAISGGPQQVGQEERRTPSEWEASLNASLVLRTQQLLQKKTPIFTRFAEPVCSLTTRLKTRGIATCAGVTGVSQDPTTLTRRFRPASKEKRGAIRPVHKLVYAE